MKGLSRLPPSATVFCSTAASGRKMKWNVAGRGRGLRRRWVTSLSRDPPAASRGSAIFEIRKIYTHINNTNPILDETSAERREIEKAGWEVAEDGMDFTV